MATPLPGSAPLAEHDPDLYALICKERARQASGLELIASENFTSRAVMECLGSCLTNKYSEGYPGARYYGGNEVIDEIERLCQSRALAAFGLSPEEWGVNVQPYSGSPANFAVMTALLKPHDRIMGLDLPAGGHLTHGFYTFNKAEGVRKPVSATSIFFESLPYSIDPESGLVDYDKLAELARIYKPALLIAGGSAYPREWDYSRYRTIADANGSILLVDMAHISGLVAAGQAVSPFAYADVVTTTTHKSLRGPRSALIFFRRDGRGFERRINGAVFPGLQGGPHEHQIAAVATQLKEVASPGFKAYAAAVVANAKALAGALVAKGHKLATGGTDNHLILWDLRPTGVTGAQYEKVCDAVGVTVNKNSVVGDKSALNPGGVRLGTPALTTRGFSEADFLVVADILDALLGVAKEVSAALPAGTPLGEWVTALTSLPGPASSLASIRARVEGLALSFPMPGL